MGEEYAICIIVLGDGRPCLQPERQIWWHLAANKLVSCACGNVLDIELTNMNTIVCTRALIKCLVNWYIFSSIKYLDIIAEGLSVLASAYGQHSHWPLVDWQQVLSLEQCLTSSGQTRSASVSMTAYTSFPASVTPAPNVSIISRNENDIIVCTKQPRRKCKFWRVTTIRNLSSYEFLPTDH